MTNEKMTPQEEAEYLQWLARLSARVAADDAEDEAYFAGLKERAKIRDAEDEVYFAGLKALADTRESHADAMRRMEAETNSMTTTEFFKVIGEDK